MILFTLHAYFYSKLVFMNKIIQKLHNNHQAEEEEELHIWRLLRSTPGISQVKESPG